MMKHASFVRAVRDWSLRRARANVVLSEGMATKIPQRRAAGGERVVVRHNWADAALRPIARDRNRLRHEWQLGDAFVVAYSGNLGRAHELDTVVGAMKLLANDPRARFVVIGGGAQLDRVE